MKTLFTFIAWLCFLSVGYTQQITKMEYWVNSDPGLGAAFPITGFGQNPVVNFSTALDGLPAGKHTIGLRSKDANGRWSHTNFVQVRVIEPLVATDIVKIEYFWDKDPGFGNTNEVIDISNPTQIINESLDFHVPGNILPLLGDHILFIRSVDSNGQFSHTNYRVVTISTINTSEWEQNGINIYPNPVVDNLNIRLDTPGNARLILYDIQGKLLLDKTIGQIETVDLSHLSTGEYFAYLWKEADKIHVVKLIKK